MRANLKHIKNTPLLLKKLRSGSNNLSDWQATWKVRLLTSLRMRNLW